MDTRNDYDSLLEDSIKVNNAIITHNNVVIGKSYWLYLSSYMTTTPLTVGYLSNGDIEVNGELTNDNELIVNTTRQILFDTQKKD